ncbi:MAG: GNAT family N-acetyltransferase [Rhizobiaceae bacterium]|jgi:CelD/BcsL family acetyltransferase involved in cellulose biosynthesis|nr:GNAT family N-acetyltransferase [Rhizobiaceae bacterium]
MQGASQQGFVNKAGPDVRFHAFEPDYEFASAEYHDLFAQSGATAFQHPLWLSLFQRHAAPARGAKMLALTERDDRGRLLALIPMTMRQAGGVRLAELCDLGISDYCAPVVVQGHEPDWRALRAALPAHDVLRIRNIRPDHAAALAAFAATTPRAAGFSAHATALAPSFSEWRECALTASFDKYLARRVRKVAAMPEARLARIDDPAEAASAVRALARLREGRFAGDMIARPEIAAFYAAIAQDGAALGFARTYRLTIDGDVAGVVFGVCHAGRYHYLLIGCDYARFGALSPGLVLYDFAIRDWIEAGGTVFDFTIGDEAFKMDFGTCPTPMAEIETASSLTGRAALLARDVRDRMRKGGAS